MKMEFFLILVLQIFVIGFSAPLGFLGLYMQKSYMQFSGHYYHFNKKDLASTEQTFSVWNAVPSNQESLLSGVFSIFSATLLPQNEIIFIGCLFYIFVGQLLIFMWAFNAVKPNSFLNTSELMLGGMQITNEKTLDSVIELVVNQYNLERKKESRIIKCLKFLYYVLLNFALKFVLRY